MAAASMRTVSRANLRGSDRVAAILLSMGGTRAANLMKHLEPDEIKRITRAAARLDPVSTAQLSELIDDFAIAFSAGANVVGDAAEVQKLLSEALPEDQVDAIMGDLEDKADPPVWDRISEMGDSEVAAIVAAEHPQVAALILSKVKSGCAAKVIARLPPESRNGVFRRMLAVRPAARETLDLIEDILNAEFPVNPTPDRDTDNHARIAEIINKLDREDMDQVLSGIESTLPKAAESLRSLMFNFDDLTKLSDRARTTLFENLTADKIVLALRGAEEEVRECVLNALSGRVRKMIQQELETGQPVPQRDVTEARQVVTDLVLQLAAEGTIAIWDDGEEEVYVS